ncbi:Ig-like domain-containing protein [Cylindrospermopsis raciborskii G7]|uniref:Ig-like domain-containing protein n=1 Tax=Cylindrospermopsis raciborskii TaxID=77022 RepID=UPI003EB6F5DF
MPTLIVGSGSQYTTIQAAINAASDGDIIEVQAGTYAEQLTIDKQLTIRGPNSQKTGNTSDRIGEAVVTFPAGITVTAPSLITVNVSGVTIEGLELRANDYLINKFPYLIETNKVNNLTVRNNHMYGGEVGIYVLTSDDKTANRSGLLIEGNYIDGGPYVNSKFNRGIYVQSTAGTIQNNTVINTNIGIQYLPYANPVGGTIRGNTVSAGSIGLYHNYQDKGAAPVTWENNVVSVAQNDRAGLKSQVFDPWTTPVIFRGIELITFGDQGSGNAPQVTFTNNSVNADISGTGYNSTVSEGLRFSNPYGNGQAIFNGNTLTGWTVRPVNNQVNQTSRDFSFSFITGFTDDVAPVTGTNATNGSSTNDTTPTINITAEVNSTVEIFNGNTKLGNATATGAGTYTFTPTDLSPGTYNFTARATNAAGNVSVNSGVFTLTVDTAAPSAPIITGFTDDVVPVTGVITAGGSSTNDPTPILSITAEAGSTVEVFRNGVSLGNAIATGAGTYTFTPPTLNPGTYSFTARATDALSRVSGESPSFILTVDTAVSAPTITGFTDNVAPVTGPITASSTNDTTPTLSITAEANSTVEVFNGNTKLGNATAAGGTTYTFTPPTLSSGTYSFTARATDAAGNVSANSTAFSLTVDTAAPNAPTITGFTDDVAPVTGAITASSTNDPTPILSITAEAGSTVEVFRDGVSLGNATATGAGTYTFTPPSLSSGTYSFTARATDAAGNVSANSTAFSLTIDTAAPNAPIITRVIDDVTPVTDNVTSGSSTNDTTPTLNITAEAGSNVEVFRNGVSLGNATPTTPGGTTYTLVSSVITDGNYSFIARATDAAGNVSVDSVPFTLTVDTTAPNAPTITSVIDDVAPVTDNVTSGSSTNDPTPTLSITAEAGSIVEIFNGNTKLGDAAATTTPGIYTFTPVALSPGTYSITARSTDGAGNISANSTAFSLTVDTGVAAPTILSRTGSDNAPVLTISAEANSTVEVFRNGVSLGNAKDITVGGTTYTITSSVLTDGNYSFTARATDRAGNVSVDSAPFNLSVDTTPPSAPIIVSAADNVDPIQSSSLVDGNITNDTTPSISISAEPGAIVEVFINGVSAGNAIATGPGTYTFTPAVPLTQGNYTFTARATDAAGNFSASLSNDFRLTIDAVASTPVITAITDNEAPFTGNVANNGITNDTTPTINITAEANSTVEVFNGPTRLGNATATAPGIYTFTPVTALSPGSYAFTARSTDVAGNISSNSTPFNLTIDTNAVQITFNAIVDDTGNSASDFLTNATNILLQGRATPGATITVTVDGIAQTTTVTAGNTAGEDGLAAWTYVLPTLNPGTYTVGVRASTPAAGNSQTVTRSLTIDTTAPAVAITGINDGASSGNILTNDTTLIFNGTAESGSLVTLTVTNAQNNTQVFQQTVNAVAGTWRIDRTNSNLPGGSYNITATATDAAGNVSTTVTRSLQIDTTAPNAPTITSVTDDVAPITGTISSTTDDTTPTLNITAEAGSTVEVFNGNTKLGNATATGPGIYTFTTTALSPGSYSLTARATDAAGNTSGSSAAFSLIIDTTAPSAPTITGFTDDVAPVTGVINTSSTNDLTPTLNITAEAGSTVEVFRDGVFVGNATANAPGIYTLTPPALTPGTYSFTARATDAAGNTSGSSAAFSLTLDTTAPSAPTITGFTDDVAPVTGVVNTSSTNDPTPTLNITAEAGSTVEVFVGNTKLGDAAATTTPGIYTFTPATALSAGAYSFTARATDGVGNISQSSSIFSLILITTSPQTPIITAVSDNVGSQQSNVPSGGSTDDTTPTLTIAAAAGTTVRIYNGDPGVQTNLLGTATESSQPGVFTFTPSTPFLNNQTVNLQVIATDTAGNLSTASTVYPITIVTGPPAAPTIVAVADDAGSIVGNLTLGQSSDDALPVLTITAAQGSTIKVFNGTDEIPGSALITGTASGISTYTFTPASLLASGSVSLTATATNAAGLTSSASAPFSYTIDRQPPAAPTITNIGTNNVFAAVGGTISGTGEAGATLALQFSSGRNLGGGTSPTTVTVGPDGTWSVNVSAADVNAFGEGAERVTVRQRDAAGNQSESTSQNFNVFTSAVQVSIEAIQEDRGLSNSDFITNDRTLTLLGKATAGSTVTITVGTTTLGGTVSVPGTGGLADWSYVIPGSLPANQTTQITAVATLAGDSSRLITQEVIVDTASPTLAILKSFNGPTANIGTGPITYTFSFSEPVVDFTTSKVLVVGGSKGPLLNPSGNLRNYTMVVTPTQGFEGDMTVIVAANEVRDRAGNSNTQDTEITQPVDILAPTITSGSVSPPISENSGSNQLVYRTTALGTGNFLSLSTNGDGSLFTIDSTGQVRLTANPNFETKPNYTFTVVATDAAGNVSEQTVTLGIINLDEVAPTITSGTRATAIPENSSVNQVVYTVTSTDSGDISGGVTYSLKPNTGDGAMFTINPTTGRVRLNASANFEAKNNYAFTVIATDAAGSASEQAVTLPITDVNESPTAIALSNNSIDENGVLNVGTLSTIDPDSNDTFQYTLVGGTGSGDNNAFTLTTAGQLSFNTPPDFETKSNYSIRVRSTDAGGLFTDTAFTINVIETNDAPSTLSLSSTTVNENVGVGTLVGLLSSTDPDASPQSFTYTLVSGTGGVDVDNSSFVIVGEQLRLSVSPDFETKSNYRINVRTTDQGGLSRDQAFTINIRDLRESLNDQITQEESSINSFILPVVGSSGAVSYQLLSLDSTPRPDWISFNPSTRQVSGTPPTNFAEAVQLRLNELDSGNNLLGSYNFKLVVQNVNDAPTTASTSRTGQEDTDITLQLSDFAFTDVDSGDSLKAVQIVAPPTAGSLLLNGNPVTYPLQVTREQISQGALRFRPAANANGPYATFQFRVLDQGDGVSSPATFTINLTAVNDPATGQPGITGTLEEGQTLTVNTGGIGDVDGLPASGFSYQWFRASVDGSSNPGLFQEITGITTPTYQLAATDINKVIRVQVSFTDQGGNLESVISNPTNLIQNRPDTPTWSGQQITGTPTQGQTLTVNTGGIGDLDGLGSFSYQWQQSSDNSVWTAISGATGTSLRLGQDQVGKLVRNLVSFTDGYGNRETLTSNPTTQVANINDPASGTPQIIGTPAKGQVLSVSTQGLSDADGIDTSTFSYQWQQSSDGNTWSDISGGTGSNLTLGDSQVNNRVRVRVSYRDYPGGPETQRTLRESGATALVSNSNLNPVEGAVVLTLNGNPLTGSPSQNQIVVANTSGIRDGDGIGALSYEWLADGQVISGATGDRLTLGQPQVGKAIAVRVRYIDGGGTNEEISSPATPPVLNVNDPALALILTGAIVQNQTLTAQLDSITDLDGAPAIQRDSQGNITNYTFQWQQSSDGTTWSNIPNATTARLNLTETLVSQRLRVTMSFTDNGGFSETVTSVATNPILNVNDAPLGAPTIGVTVPNQGQTLTANTNGISDIDGLGTFNYQWQRLNDTTWEAITGANAATYNPSQRDVNRSLRVRVTYTDGRGTQETLFSTATGLVIDLPDGPTGQPTISGTLTQGELLTADPSSIADLDGLGIFSYQWQQSTDGTTWNNIPNATGNTYRLTQNQVGRQVRVRVNYIDGLGTRETVTSTATTPILNVNDAPTGSVTVRGTPAIGVTLSADTRSLVDPDDEVNSVRAFSYQWFANGVSITGATNATYTPIDDDLNKTLTVQVTYTDQRGTVERVLSPNSLAVISADQLLTGDVSILSTNALEGVDASGNLIAQENVTLVADPWTTQITFNGIRRVQFSYQWYADGVAIIGANSDLFTPGDDHVGKVITVAVTPTGLSSSLLSKDTAPVVNVNDQPEGIPTFSGLVNGAAQEDSTLTVNVSGISDADGIDATTPFSFQWQQSTDSNNWNNITNATGRSFTPGDAQSGQRLRLVTTYTDLRGTTEIVPTPVGSLNNIPGQVRPVNDLPTGGIGINGFLVVGQVLTAASTLADADGISPSGVTYTWQRQNPATTEVRGTVGEWLDIATGATYTIADTVSGSPLRVVARYTDQQGFSETITSSPTTNVIRNAREGVVITWFSAQPATSQWQVFSSSTGWQDLAGETRASLQTKNDLGGRQVRLLLNGTPTPALFIQTVDNGVGTVSPITIAPESSQPSFVLGATLKTGSVVGDLDGLDPNSTNVIYQWQRSNNDSSWNNILKDGDKAIYVVTDEDLNQNLRVQITYTDLQGFTSTIYSAATSVIQTAPPPVASGSFDAMTANGDDIASVEEFPVNNDTSSLAGGLTLTGTVTSPNTSVTLTFGGQTRVARLAVDTDGNRISDASTSTTSPVAWSYTLTAADLTWLVGNEDNQVTARFTRTEGNQIGIGKTSRTLFISQGVLADRTAPTVIDASQPGGLTADVLRNLQALGVEFQGVDTSQPNALVFTYGTADEFNAGADTADKGTGAGLNTSTGTIQGVEQFETGQDGTYTIPGSDGSSTPISAPPRSSFTPVADPLAMTVSGVRPGATVTTQFYLPANVASRLAANDTPLTRWTYYKLDSTDNQFKAFTDNNGKDLYAFRVEGGNNDNLWQTGEQVVLTLTLTDGDKWDRDGLANGIIVDPGLAGLSVNQAPTITSPATTNFAENGTGTAYTVLATDPDAGTTLTYSLLGTDAARFNINSSTGAVTFKTAPNFEVPGDGGGNNIYDITVSASDGSLSASQAVAITVTNVNEAPTITSSATASFAENSKLVGRISVQNPEPEDVITFALAGVDAKLLSIDSQGNLTFNKAPDFEKPEDAGKNNIYQVQVTVGDGNTPPVTQDIDIKVEDVNEAPAAIGDFLAIVGDTSGSIEPLKNDTDPDSGDKLKIIGVTDGKQGKVEIIGDQLKYTLLDAAYTGDDVFSYTISDQGNLTATANVKVNVTGTKVVVNSGVITDVQPGDPLIPSEAGSLSGIVNNVSFNFRAGYNPTQARDILQRTLVSTDAAFNNLFGLYEIDNATGAVNGIAPGQPGYARAALNRAVSSFAVRAGGSGNGITGNVVVGGDKFYAPFVIANGGNLFGSMQDAINTFFQLNADNSRATAENYTSFPVAYFSFGAANPDGAAHIKSFGNNIFGFEDLPAGVGVNDYDFNDTVFSFG